jgi:hypothetical protein
MIIKKQKSIKIKYLFFLLFIVFHYTNAQKSNEVLLELIKNKHITQSERFQYLCEISVNYPQNDSIEVYNYAYQALKIAQEMRSEIKQVMALENLSRLSSRFDDTKNQIKYADECFLLASKTNNPEAIAYANYCIALKYQAIDDKENYISYMLKALTYFEKAKKRYDKLVNAYENLAAHFGDLKNIEVSKKYGKKALDLSLESKSPISIASALTSWALCLVDLAGSQKPTNIKLLDSASNCYLKSIEIQEKNNEQLNYSYGRTWLNLTSLYLDEFYKSRRVKTIEYLLNTQNVCLKINDPHLSMVMYGQQAQFYINLKDIENLEDVLLKIDESIKKQKKVHSKYKLITTEMYMYLATLKNDFASYRKYFDLYKEFYADILDQENRKREFNATIRFETEQKNREIQSLSESIQNKKKTNYLYISLFILSLIALVFMYRAYNFRHKSYIKDKLLLQKANEEANLLSKLKEEENKKIQLENKYEQEQKELYQKQLMATVLQIENKNKILLNLKEESDKIQKK